ncbi:hypothetical protein [Gilvimarinus polysaccharolyticus]|uniref:hypothetical protein n=1 Tax=Gilvimarinus polysaccharolyticus TaxID=863921 RepID=UPI0006739B3C|nr:hypothetical protein [Gilvimarinus polysaccharolyticus]
MRLSEAIDHGDDKNWSCAQIRKNPSTPSQWFVMLIDKNQKQYMLVNDDESHILFEDLNMFSELFKSLSIKEFTVFL